MTETTVGLRFLAAGFSIQSKPPALDSLLSPVAATILPGLRSLGRPSVAVDHTTFPSSPFSIAREFARDFREDLGAGGSPPPLPLRAAWLEIMASSLWFQQGQQLRPFGRGKAAEVGKQLIPLAFAALALAYLAFRCSKAK